MVEASCLPAHQLLHLLHTPRSSYIEMMVEYIPLETIGYEYFDEYSEKLYDNDNDRLLPANMYTAKRSLSEATYWNRKCLLASFDFAKMCLLASFDFAKKCL